MMTMILVRSPFTFNHFFFPGIKPRSSFDFCAWATFVGERHDRIRYGSINFTPTLRQILELFQFNPIKTYLITLL